MALSMYGALGKENRVLPTAVKTAAYTALPGDFVPCDASGGSLTVVLPTAPQDQSRIAVKMVKSNATMTNTVTVQCGGSDVLNSAGGSTSVTLSLPGHAVTLQYVAATAIWYVQCDDLPLTALTALFPDWTMAARYGVKADGQTVSDGAITSGNNVLTSASATFTSADIGKRCIIYGAGASGIHFGANIIAVNSANSVTLSTSAATTVSGAIVVWATDVTTAMQAANANAPTGHTIYLPAGIMIMTGGFGSLTCQRITGNGPGQYSNQAFTSAEAAGTTIVCDPSNTFSLFGSTSPGFGEVDHLAVVWTASGGKIFATEGFSNPVIHDCHFEVNDPAGNGQVTASFVETPFGSWERCNFVQTSSTRQLPLYQSISTSSGAEANITFRSCQWLNINTDNNQYLCDIQFTGSNSGGDGYAMQIRWQDNTFGRAWGGAIRCLGVINPVVDNCGFWDLNDSGHPVTGNHTMYFGAGSGGSPCRGVRILGAFKNRTWANGTSLWDLYCEPTTVGVLVEGFSSKPDSATSGANVYLNFNGCTDVTLIGCQSPSGKNPGSTVVTNPGRSRQAPDWLNVLWFGADPTGTADSTSALQAALNTVPGTGGVVYFPAGTYKISSALTAPSFTTLQGAGPSSTVISQASTSADGLKFTDTTAVSIRDLRVSGPGSGTGIGIHGLLSANASLPYLDFRNLYITGFGSNGIDLNTPIVSAFTRVISAVNGGHGWALHSSTACTSVAFSACYANANAGHGYDLQSVQYSTLSGCAADSNAYGYFLSGCQGVTLTGCGAESTVNDSLVMSGGNGNAVTGWHTFAQGHYSIHATGGESNLVIIGATDTSPAAGAVNCIVSDSGTHVCIAGDFSPVPNSLAAGSATTLFDASGAASFAAGVTAGGTSFFSSLDVFGSLNIEAGWLTSAVKTVTSAYSVSGSDAVILASASSAAFTVTLPSAVGITGQRYTIIKSDSSANAVTVAAAGTQKINGAATISLPAQYAKVTVLSDGSNWWEIA